MDLFFGLKLIDIGVIVGYFAVIMLVGMWASFKVHTEEDFFLGGRSFGKGLLMMHWLCTGTHSEQAVQVSGATARVGLGGIWYQWMWLFSTPFYWLIAPMIRRLRVITTGDMFRIRYNRSLEMLYAVVALLFLVLSVAMLLRGAGKAMAGATNGAIPTNYSVIVLAVLFSTYVITGGLMAAAYTDYLQGLMLIALSVMLIPAGLSVIGGMSALHEKLPATMLSITAPAGASEGSLDFVLAMSLLGLVGIVVQPHVMTANGSGKTELEARIGMCFGNFIKRFLTIAWAFTGLIALVHHPELLQGLAMGSEEARDKSETLFGTAIQSFLGDGWRGLMIACIIAGVTSAEAFMVVGSALFTRNFYQHAVPNASDRHYLWVGRAASAGILIAGILVATFAGSVTQLVTFAFQMIGLMGGAFWMGVLWRRTNPFGVWVSFLATLWVWLVTIWDPTLLSGIPLLQQISNSVFRSEAAVFLHDLPRPYQILVMLVVQFGVLILASLFTPPQNPEQLDPFFARLHTPVGKEQEVALAAPPDDLFESATLGMHGVVLDYRKASVYAYPALQRVGIEIPRLNWFDCAGFLAACGLVGALIGLLAWLASLGAG